MSKPKSEAPPAPTHPREGGSYVRLPDGTLTRPQARGQEHPVRPGAAPAPAGKPALKTPLKDD
ncbi:hypothetical protein [Halodurantibacterium flavum]|uniref:Uncharacterized protein n=1 Tax=Halodurantibacterium flavum TaxID=1382802 RepID=A0ABW4S938_9RHOB